jgi:hypothetical protein
MLEYSEKINPDFLKSFYGISGSQASGACSSKRADHSIPFQT